MLATATLGFEVGEGAGGNRLVMQPALAQHLSPLLVQPALSGAELVTVAYCQPVMRAETRARRGGSASTVITLWEREPVEGGGLAAALRHP